MSGNPRISALHALPFINFGMLEKLADLQKADRHGLEQIKKTRIFCRINEATLLYFGQKFGRNESPTEKKGESDCTPRPPPSQVD